MKNNILKLGLLLLISAFIITGCALKNQINEVKNGTDNKKTKVVVTILPLIEFVEKIGGDRVDVSEVIPPGYEPHSYELNANMLTKISEANLYVEAGHVEFENSNMSKIIEQNKSMKVIDGSEGIILRNLENNLNNKEGEDESVEGGKDPHTWFSVNNAKIYVENIYKALVELNPENENYYKNNKEAYLSELDKLDNYLKENLLKIENKNIIVYHPAFGYLLDEYGLKQIPIEIEGKEPTASQIEELTKEAKAENIKVIFVQKEFSTKNAEAIAAEIGGITVQIDPLAQDFANNLKNIGKTIANNLE